MSRYSDNNIEKWRQEQRSKSAEKLKGYINDGRKVNTIVDKPTAVRLIVYPVHELIVGQKYLIPVNGGHALSLFVDRKGDNFLFDYKDELVSFSSCNNIYKP